MTEKGGKHLSWADRLKIEALLKAKHKKHEIADLIGVSIRTIFYELKRGEYMHMNSDLTQEVRYSPDIAEKKYREHLKEKGADLKIGKDRKYAEFIENKVADEGYSPDAALALAKKEGFTTVISKQTFYNYIDAGLFLKLTNKALPVKGRRKDKKKKVRRKQAKANAGTSIEKRPEIVDAREEFGHWEMDSVVGPQGQSNCTLLVLTERKTREEIIRKLLNHGSDAVVEELDKLEALWGDDFTNVFKTITVDNGVEFSFTEKLERSSLKEGIKRVSLYYCHAYCSCERGSNENQNRMIRRKIPKGYNFDHMTEEEIKAVETWINTYPRKLFDYDSSQKLFEQELEQLKTAV